MDMAAILRTIFDADNNPVLENVDIDGVYVDIFVPMMSLVLFRSEASAEHKLKLNKYLSNKIVNGEELYEGDPSAECNPWLEGQLLFLVYDCVEGNEIVTLRNILRDYYDEVDDPISCIKAERL